MYRRFSECICRIGDMFYIHANISIVYWFISHEVTSVTVTETVPIQNDRFLT